MPTRFPAGLTDVKAADFSSYVLSSLSETDLGLISRKCLEIVLAGGADREAAHAMLTLVSAEKTQRAAKSSRRSTMLWSVLIVVSIVSVGLVQAYMLYALSFAPAEGEEPGSCEQPQHEFEV